MEFCGDFQPNRSIMSVSNPETNNPETNITSVSELRPKQVTEPIYTYAISWGWLVAGLVCVLGLGGVAGTMYFWQTRNMPTKIVEVVQRMIEEAEQERAKVELTDDLAEKGRLMRRSVQLRSEAANFLDNYRRVNPDASGEVILGKLYDILESLYRDHGGSTTAVGVQRGEQLSRLAVELARTVDESRSIPYRTRLLEIAWDRRIFADIISRGKELLSASQALKTENYEAMRYIAMACFDGLPTHYYDPSDYQLPPGFPETMDGLLAKLNSERPDDIEIAKRYAEFLVSVHRNDRPNFTASASELLHGRGPEERLALARNCIDTMVQRNENDPAAYLARYHFVSQFSPSEALDLASPDLQKVLELSPSSPEGLILSGVHALNQARIARAGGEQAAASNWENRAEEHLRHTTRDNPGDPIGYLYLGEFLLLHRQNTQEAIDVWSRGLQNSGTRSGNEELIGRLIMLLLQQGRVEEAKARLDDLARVIDEMRVSRPMEVVRRTQDMLQLLRARMYHTEATVALSRIDAAVRENRLEDALRFRNLVQQRRFDAVRQFEEILVDFGTLEEHYILERRSVYSSLLPQSLLQLAQLKLDMSEYDRAATYFERALRFTDVAKQALIGMSIAYQQGNRLDMATQVLEKAHAAFPDDLSIHYTYAMVLFRSQVTSNAVTLETLNGVQKELESLENSRSELPQPWILDVRLIHLGVAKANLSNQAEVILEAMNNAVRRFRALERQAFPPDAAGNVRNYIDDPAFVAELVGIYSSLAARADFDRLLAVLRGFPDGEDAYYEARVNDALRRDSRNEALEIIDEAIESPRLSNTRRDQFVGLLRNLRGGGSDTISVLDNVYNQLKTTFDESPESLRPQAFFILAEMSLDRGDMERAQRIKERLKQLEGLAGTNWRYIEVRQMLAGDDPDYNQMREIQVEIVRYRNDWDRSHILSALIEEQYLALNPGDTPTREKLVAAYRNAIRCGNMQPEVWGRLIQHLDDLGRSEDARLTLREAALRGVMLESRTGQLPQPYNRMYAQVNEAIGKEDAVEADTIARQCIRLAEIRGEKPELIFTLHLMLGKVFLDESMFDSAERHLSETARRGGTYIYPLALCVAKSGEVANDPAGIDSGFTLLLDEIDLMPSAMPLLLPAILVLLAQVQPSEAIFERIDALMNRIEKGERLTLKTTLEASDDDHELLLGTRWVGSRKIMSLMVRFPGNTENLDPSALQFISPEELVEEEPE